MATLCYYDRMTYPQKITFGEMHAAGGRGLLKDQKMPMSNKTSGMLWILGLVVAIWNMPRFLDFVVSLVDPDAAIGPLEGYAYIAFFIMITGTLAVSFDGVREAALREAYKRSAK